MGKKRKFGDEVLYFTIQNERWMERQDIKALFHKGKIKGILEMDNGHTFYFIQGVRFDIYRNITISNHIHPMELEKVHSSFCFDNAEGLLLGITKILNP